MFKWTKEQDLAIHEDGRNILVSAGAGSGKTAVLTERVITKVRKGTRLNRLLVLTFTNAAAKEMKERIKLSLEKEAVKDDSLKNALEYLEGAYITTFDSFSLSLVKKYHYLLNIPRDISIINNSFLDYQSSLFLEEIFDYFYEQEDEDFKELNATFNTKNDLTLKASLLKLSNTFDLKYDKLNFLKTYKTFPHQEQDYKKYLELFKSLQTEIKTLFDDLSLEADEKLTEGIYLSIEDLIKADGPDEIKDFILKGFPNTPSKADLKVKSLKDKLKSKVETLIKDYSFFTKEEHFAINEKSSSNIKMILKILIMLEEKLLTFKKKYNKYTHSDIAKMSIEVVLNNLQVKEELSSSFDEIMLDEYQDTSDLQEQLISLISNNNVYVVGDIKQSIYQFRNANPNIFKEKYQEYSSGLNGLKIDLNENFRSRPEVIESLNQLFSKLMTLEYGGADYQDNQLMIYGNKVYEKEKTQTLRDSQILTYDNDTEFKDLEIEAHIILNDIKNKLDTGFEVIDKQTNLLRKARLEDFTILIDRANSFDLYKKIFEHHQIALNKYTKTSVLNSDEIFLIKNLMILHQGLSQKDFGKKFNYAFTSIARSYLFSISDDQIYQTLIQNKIFKSEIIKKVNEICKKELNTYQLLKELIESFDFYEKFTIVGDHLIRTSNLDFLLDIAKEIDDFSYSKDQFIELLETAVKEEFKMEVEIAPVSLNSVKIMTIHASKGLEFPITYLAGLSKKFNKSEFHKKINYTEDYGIILPIYEDAYKYSFYKTLYLELENIKMISEKIRLFYVALSRAKEQLILVVKNFDKEIELKDANNFQDFLIYAQEDISKYIKEINLTNINLSSDYKFATLFNYQKYLNDEKKLSLKVYDDEIKLKEALNYSKINLDLLDEDDLQNIDEGNRFHYILETIDLQEADLSKLNAADKKYVEKFFDLGLDFKNAKIYQEYEFISNEGIRRHGVIDLVLEYDESIKIIDYKLHGTTDPAYIKQLKGYKEYMEKISSKKIKTYLYSIIEGKLIVIE